MVLIGALILAASLMTALPMYAIPATLSLPRGRRTGLVSLTLSQAADQLKASQKQGPELVEAARQLVGERMRYCRRNSFDACARAFERGYGYCQQSAFALATLLKMMGIEAYVVSATRNRFANGKISGHAWVETTVNGRTFFIDPRHYAPATGEILFTPLSKIFHVTPVIRSFAGWGSIAVNASRYYRTRSDTN